MRKSKVFLFSDNAKISEVVFFDLSTIMEMINLDEHEEGDDYQYTITVAWMTEEEIENLPEAEF